MRLTFGLVERLLLGMALAAFVAIQSYRRGSLSEGGQWAAFFTGSVAVAAGWPWAVLLFLFYATSTALTRYGVQSKRARTEAINEPERAREAAQVFANGGVFVAAALGSLLLPGPGWWWLGAGALSAAAADTWATEVGTLWGGEPRALVGGGAVPAGMSGGVTFVGTMAGAMGGIVMGAAAALLTEGRSSPGGWAVTCGGIAGMLADSALGATWQARRWCSVCGVWTERYVHTCLYRTTHRWGLRWMGNDTVNALATATGGLLSWVAWTVLSR